MRQSSPRRFRSYPASFVALAALATACGGSVSGSSRGGVDEGETGGAGGEAADGGGMGGIIMDGTGGWGSGGDVGIGAGGAGDGGWNGGCAASGSYVLYPVPGAGGSSGFGAAASTGGSAAFVAIYPGGSANMGGSYGAAGSGAADIAPAGMGGFGANSGTLPAPAPGPMPVPPPGYYYGCGAYPGSGGMPGAGGYYGTGGYYGDGGTANCFRAVISTPLDWSYGCTERADCIHPYTGPIGAAGAAGAPGGLVPVPPPPPPPPHSADAGAAIIAPYTSSDEAVLCEWPPADATLLFEFEATSPGPYASFSVATGSSACTGWQLSYFGVGDDPNDTATGTRTYCVPVPSSSLQSHIAVVSQTPGVTVSGLRAVTSCGCVRAVQFESVCGHMGAGGSSGCQ